MICQKYFHIDPLGGGILKREDLLSDIIGAFKGAKNAKIFSNIQVNFKGENFLLAHLFENGGNSTPGKLAEFLNVSAARIAAMLRSLEGKGLVERIVDKNDRRFITVRITESGTRLVKKLKTELDAHASKMVEKLGEDDCKEFVRILKKIIKIENDEN